MRYALHRLLQLVIVFLIVSFAILVLMRLGGGGPRDLAIRILNGPSSDEQVAATIARYHLDRNYLVQYGFWLRDLLLHFDLGFSTVHSTPVSKLLAPRIMVTLLLTVYAVVFGLLVAIPVAMLQANKRDSWFDRVSNLGAFVGVGVPTVVLGVFIQWLLTIKWKVFSSLSDEIYPWDDWWQHVRNFFLPTLVLVITQSAIFARVLRADMIGTLQSDYVTLASAKGVPVRRVLWRHALPNSVFGVLTAVGTTLGALIGGAVVVETIFDLDGIGHQLLISVLKRDLPTVQGFVAIIVLVVVVVNLVVDLSYAWIDPRVRLSRALS